MQAAVRSRDATIGRPQPQAGARQAVFIPARKGAGSVTCCGWQGKKNRGESSPMRPMTHCGIVDYFCLVTIDSPGVSFKR